MNWTEVTINTTNEAVEAISGVLYTIGVGGVTIEDNTLLEEANRNTARWDVLDDDVRERYSGDGAVIKAYFSPDKNMEEVLLQLGEGIERAKEFFSCGDVKITTSIVSEDDWENSWKKYYKPIKIGERIMIKPLWEDLPDCDGDVVIELDPGMAFGTGTHETTRMCLTLLEKYIDENSDFLDIGTGSGILSIAAAKLGAKSLVCTDIDPVAVKIAKENAQINGVENLLDIRCGDLTECIDGKYNIITANIIADAIIMLTKDVSQFLTDDGVYITSGIINHRADDVKAELEKNGFVIDRVLTDGDWVAIVSKRS